MAITVYFNPKSMSTAQYEGMMRELEAQGKGRPEGRLHHSCFGSEGSLMVYDVWESPESFEAFGATLMPIIAKSGVDVGEPTVMPVHNMI